MTVRVYRKKPVEVEARHHNNGVVGVVEDLAKWCGGTIWWGSQVEKVAILIPTLEGEMRADFGDWIIKGVAGEFYPCKPDIFDATYELVSS